MSSGPERRPDDATPPDEFDAIVAAWRSQGAVPDWPDDDADPDGDLDPDGPDGPVAPASAAATEDEGHYHPPEPPPLPRLGPPAAVGLGLIALGLVLVMAPSLVGVPTSYGLPLGLLVLAAGLGWLVLRLWPSPPPRGDGDGEDDGAVL